MRKILLTFVAAQALAFNAYAEVHKHQSSSSIDKSEVEDLALPEDAPITSYFGTKDYYRSRKALINTVITTDPLMYPHTNPINVLSTVNTTLIFWGRSWKNSVFISDKIVGLNYLHNNFQTSTYKDSFSEFTTLNHSLKGQKIDSSTTASSNPNAVLSEVCRVIGSANIDPKGYYPVYSDIKRGTATYCAFHSAGTCGGKPVQFAFFFNLDEDPGCNPNSPYAPALGSPTSQQPGAVSGLATPYQQSQGLAALANVTAHELAETVTDPAYFPRVGGPYWGGWYDATGAENGDKCAWTFGPSNTGASPGTVLIGTFDWKLQGEWSNNAHTSGFGGYPTQNGQLTGCVTGS